MKARVKMPSTMMFLLGTFLIVFCWNNVVHSETPVSVSNTCAMNTSLPKEASGSDSMEYPKMKSAQTGKMLKHSVAQMRSAQQEIERFVERKASQKTKSYSWYVAEIVTNAGEIVVMRVDFYGEKGPASFATKRVYQDEKRSKELKNKGYVFYYHENGTVKMFQTRGTPETIVQFYPSGKVKELGVMNGDKTLTEMRCREDDTVEYEKSEEKGVGPAKR